jgi:hypothetical protein
MNEKNKTGDLTNSTFVGGNYSQENHYYYKPTLELFITVIEKIALSSEIGSATVKPNAPDVSKKIPHNKLDKKKGLFGMYRELYVRIENAKEQLTNEGKNSFALACETIQRHYFSIVEDNTDDWIKENSITVWDTIRLNLCKESNINDSGAITTVEHLMYYVFSRCKIFLEPDK